MKWISINEEKPSLGRNVLVTTGKYIFCVVVIEDCFQCTMCDYTSHIPFQFISHWMELPELPNA